MMRRRMATMYYKGDKKFETDRYRRYQGQTSLGIGKYYSVCDNEYGNDNGTLCSELQAYHDPYVSGVIEIYDTCDEQHREKLKDIGNPVDFKQSIVLILRNHSISEYAPHVLNSLSVENCDSAFAFPLSIHKETINCVLDLRERESINWLVKHFGTIECEPENIWSAFKCRGSIDSFTDMLPEMINQEIGGGGFHYVVGERLRHEGVNALIFPSSRIDCGVELNNDHKSRYWGWNLVDYRGNQVDHIGLYDHDEGWLKKISSRRALDFALPNSLGFDSAKIEYIEENGSWNVTGLTDARRALHTLLDVEYLTNKISGDFTVAASLLYPFLLSMSSNKYVIFWGGLIKSSLLGEKNSVDAFEELITKYKDQPGYNKARKILEYLKALNIEGSEKTVVVFDPDIEFDV